MLHAIHITTLKRMLQSPEPVDLKLWTRSGEIQCWHRCISLRYEFYKGTRRMKLLDSNEIRQLRDSCVFEINGMEVFMKLDLSQISIIFVTNKFFLFSMFVCHKFLVNL